MFFNRLFIAAVVAAGVFAAPAHHNHHKRDVVVVTEVAHYTVVVTNNAPVATAANNEEAGATNNRDTSSDSSTTASKSNGKSNSGSSSSSSSSSSNVKGKGVTYSPYTETGECKSFIEVKTDVAKLSGFEIIRLYGVDCNQVENVLKAKSEKQKLFLGIFFMDAIEAGVSQMAKAVSEHGSWSDVTTVSVGNELVNSGSASVDQISSYVATARKALTAAGYTGPVVSVDTFIATINNPGLCKISDYVAVNAHAYFDKNTEAANAGTWLKEQIKRVSEACGGATVLVTESGWPHDGDNYGAAVASADAQAVAIKSITDNVENVILFNAFDDKWKADGDLKCEKYWGVLSS